LIPDSLTAVLSFLLLIAPGIVWELQQSRYEPSVKESTLVELSRVILASLVATSIAGAIMLPVAWIPLYQGFDAEGGDPFSSLDTSVPFVGAALATCATACGLVLLAAALKWPDRQAPISQMRVWHKAFVQWKPKESAPPYLAVELKDGTVWRGSLKAFDSDPEDDQRTIALGAPLSRRRPPIDQRFAFNRWKKKDSNPPKLLAADKVVILAEGQIQSIQVTYPTKSE
jgi:hypothetical protein